MKRVLVRSVFDAFEYVMEHFYPNGQQEMAERTDTYAVISIQDTHTDGFGFEFRENHCCKGVLTLYFDDTIKETEGAELFTGKQAEQIIEFITAHKAAETLLVHCYGGQSRSRAVGAFAVKLLGGDNSSYLSGGTMNQHVYRTLDKAWLRMKLMKRI